MSADSRGSMTREEREKMLAKLRKLLTLSREGVDGEKVKAQAVMTNLMHKYEIKMEDFSDDNLPKFWHYIPCRGREEARVLRQICAKVQNQVRLHERQTERLAGPSFLVNKLEAAEIDLHWAAFRHAWKKEKERMFLAFIFKHGLHAEATSDENSDNSSRLSAEDEQAIAAMMRAMDDVAIRKRLMG